VSRRRRAILLLGLALALGGLAASDVARREAAVAGELGPPVPVIVARGALASGAMLRPDRLAVRLLPARYVPPGTFRAATALTGLRAARALPAGAFLSAAELRDPAAEPRPGAPIRSGERVADVVARGAPELVSPGARVDVLVTREGSSGGRGRTELALQDVEVLAGAPAPEGGGSGGGGAGGGSGSGENGGGPLVAASLRVTLRQAVFLAAAQSFAKEIRLLPRAPGDRAHLGEALVAGG